MAQQVAESTGVESAVDQALALLAAGQGEQSLNAIRAMSGRPDWSPPARDRAVFELARALSDFDQGAVPETLVEFLAAYQPETLVAHEEAPDMGVPLFPVRATLAGV
ncbi:MAG: hypothetical protein R3212_10600, partial [Xanthomonadales bacterium]|nr:hypothetical protein [Xanthomonadales bacterium]